MLTAIRPALDSLGQIFEADGFGDIVVHAGRETDLAGALEGFGGHGDDGRVPAGRFGAADRAGSGVAIHFGHVAIHEDQRIGEKADHPDGFVAVGGDVDAEAELFEQAHGDLLIDGVIFRDQDA
ncbi:MAG: hypothetical protein ABSH45_01160 [Bryobacteraceae bacterium]